MRKIIDNYHRYFEGKENDVRSKNFKPGKVSEELRVFYID
jgi:hypothetical protein